MEEAKPTINKFKKIMVEMYRWYPAYVSEGDFEKEFGKKEGERIIKKLDRDGLIDAAYDFENDKYYYDLTNRGMDFAISIVNLNLSQKIHKFSKIIAWLTIVLALIGIIQIITSII